MTRVYERADRLAALLRSCLLAIVTSEGVYLGLMMLFNGVLNAEVFLSSMHLIDPLRNYVVVPWSGVMLGAYLVRERKNSGPDIWLLALLSLWLTVPFIYRFGAELFTVSTAFNYILCFFAFYASVRQSDAVRRARQLDVACALVGLLSIALGGALLYCAATGEVFYSYWDTLYFGVVKGQLQHSMHYNTTAMLALVCTMMCLVGLCRSRRKPAALFYLAGVVIMALVVVLTQSRTARYAMLAAFAVGTWNGLAAYLPVRRNALRQAAALACAAVVLVGGYVLCRQITDAALAHYAGLPSPVIESVLPGAIAEEEAKEEKTEQKEKALKARKAGDSTFSDRTNIWKNVFKNWRENPKYMFIGNGAGRTKWLITENTIHEAAGYVKVHNAYLHFAAEFGLIGFAVLAAFMLSIVPSVLRVFFARADKRMPGGCALCMLLISILATGMMEIEPLDGMTVMNMALFFALAQLAGAGREMKR